MKLIGLMGKAGAGKDTVFRAMQTLGINCTRLAFGDALKQEVAAALSIPVSCIEEDKAKFRTLLQWWGTDWRREQFCEDYWVLRVEETLFQLGGAWEGVAVITDVRFANEMQFVRDRGGLLIRVERLGQPRLTGAEAQHASEQAIDHLTPDCTILNDGHSFEALTESVRRALEGKL